MDAFKLVEHVTWEATGTRPTVAISLECGHAYQLVSTPSLAVYWAKLELAMAHCLLCVPAIVYGRGDRGPAARPVGIWTGTAISPDKLHRMTVFIQARAAEACARSDVTTEDCGFCTACTARKLVGDQRSPLVDR